MDNYTIAEAFTLPSKGKVYNSELVVPTFKIASMTTNHEMMRLSPSELPYKNLCDVIDDCMVESPGISAYDMCVGDYQFCLHKLRIVTYGSEYKISSVCPYCGYTNNEVINLEDFTVKEYTEEFEKYREFELPVTKKRVRLKIETPRRLDQVTEKIKEFKKKTNNTQPDQTLLFTISTLIDTIDGQKPNPLKLEEWLKVLPMRDTNVIVLNADKMNDSIGIDTTMALTCEMCTLTYQTGLKITSEFFRPTLDI